MNAGESRQPHPGSVELCGAGNHSHTGRGDVLLLQRRADAHAKRFAENDPVARLRRARLTWRGSTRPCHQAVDRLHRINAVAAGHGNAGSLADRFTAVENSPDCLERKLVDRHRHQCKREQRTPAHGVDIRDGIGRSDGTEVERIVHYRHEKIGCGDYRLMLVDLVDGGIVAGLDADQQLGRDETCRSGLGENLLEYRGRELAPAASAM